jgi:hypothetical protein
MVTKIAPQQELIRFIENPRDVTGNSDICERTEAWDGFGRGWSVKECGLAGAAIANTLIEYYDGDSEGARTMATKMAIQHPPLLGSKLIEFTNGIQSVIPAQKV